MDLEAHWRWHTAMWRRGEVRHSVVAGTAQGVGCGEVARTESPCHEHSRPAETLEGKVVN
jgi:hypothetical protein